MNRIDQLFQYKKEGVLNIYFTAGFPALDDTTKIILALDKAGVDIIEIGMPYSDPMADGPTIQESGSKALKNGMTLNVLFDQLKNIRTKTQVPLLFMGYLNQMMQFGVDRFLNSCQQVGIDGLIIPDLPVDIYEEELKDKIENSGLHVIFLITPQTSESRIRKIDDLAKGFIYMVSSASITGAKSDISKSQLDYFKMVDTLQLKNPRLIGFGISNHDTFFQACQYAHGAIIGSAFIRHLETAENGVEDAVDTFVRSLRGNH
ncbi:MAG: tryptophan synthase subunit alpha [Saprospiraceae bacterium]|nr:tryptophan synthase subunit alpha [Saprospiraceae bacterium]